MRKLPALISLSMLIALAALICRCSLADLAGGGTEDVNAKVIGTVLNPDSTPASYAQVQLIPADHDPVRNGHVRVLTDTTNEEGEFQFTVSKTGLYNAQIVDISARTRAISARLAVAAEEDTLSFPPVVLSKPGTVKVMMPPGANTADEYLYIPGTTVFAYLQNSSGFVMFDSVPSTIAADIALSTTNASSSTVLRYGVRVKSMDTSIVWNSGWNYCRKITLNTSSSGADIAGSVTNFPALIRLTGDSFDFTQAGNDGQDIRFAKSDTTFLPYEIERWDAPRKRAEIWVKVDTVHGNDSTQTLTMYWGNGKAAAQSNGRAVFDTAAGFSGVYHLGENGDSVFDATGDAFNGKNAGSAPAAGMIGNARNFANGNYIKIPGLLKSPSNVTLSAWVRSDTSNRGQDGHLGEDIVSIGDHAGIRLDDSFVGTCGYYCKSIVNDTSFAITGSGKYLANTGWHFIAYSINTTTHVHVLYIDGAQSATFNDVDPVSYAGLGTDSYIGIHGNNLNLYNFTGWIDEVRVNNRSLSSDWIKLCFMNQKDQDALVKR